MRKLLSKKALPTLTLNKKLIVVLASLLIFLFLWLILHAFSTDSKAPPSHLSVSTNTSALQSGLTDLNTLPQTYASADQINTIMARGEGGPAVQKLLSTLQQEQADLQKQLSSLKGQEANNYSPQAANSAIFFAGGAPQRSSDTASAGTSPANSKDQTSSKPTPDSYAQQNMQTQKLDFLATPTPKEVYNTNLAQAPASPYILQAGSVIPATLQTKISTDVPGAITAVVDQDVYDSINGKYLLIPRGSRLIGEYSSLVAYGQDTVQAKFTRLIRPDGSSIVLPNQPGVNNVGMSGFQDEVNNHMGSIVGAGILTALFNIPSIIATNQMNTTLSSNCTTVGNTQVCSSAPNLSNVATASALQSVGQAATQIGTSMANKSLNIQPTITINAGYQFSVMVTKDTVLPPYTSDGHS